MMSVVLSIYGGMMQKECAEGNVRKLIVCGQYFTYFNYIASNLQQMKIQKHFDESDDICVYTVLPKPTAKC